MTSNGKQNHPVTAAEREEVIRHLRQEIEAIDELVDERAELEREIQALRSANGGHSASSRGSGDALHVDVADQVVELLRQAGRPMHYEDIWCALKGRVRAGGTHPAQSLLSRYSREPRLRRTAAGTYGLQAWCTSSDQAGSVADKVVGLLRRSGEPMHYRQIYTALAQQVIAGGKRPECSLLARYSTDARLVRVARGVYALREWTEPKVA